MSPAIMAKSLPVMPRVEPPLSVYLGIISHYSYRGKAVFGRVEAVLIIAGGCITRSLRE